MIVNNDQAHHQSFPRPMGGQELEASDVEGGLSSFTHLYDLIIINYNLYGLIIVPIATNWNFNDETNYNADQIIKYIRSNSIVYSGRGRSLSTVKRRA